MTTTLEANVKTYAKIDDELKRISEEVKALRANKNSIANDISSQMEQKQVQEVDCPGDTKVKKYTRKSSSNVFKKDNVEECALALLGADRTATLLKMIEDKKEVKESTAVKRMSSKRAKTS